MPQFERVQFAPGRKQQFIDWIQHELTNTIADRAELDRKWENALIQLRAQMPEGTSDWPWPGAPNIEFPLTDIHFQPVYADLIQTLHAPEDYWTPQARRPDRVPHANAMRRGITAIERRYLKMRKVNERAFIDLIGLGTAIWKDHWSAGRKPIRDYNPTTGLIEKRVRTWSHPVIEHVPLQRFYIPANAWEIDPDVQGGAAWVAQEFRVTPSELRVWAQGSDSLPGFEREAVEKVLRWAVTEERPVEKEIREEDHFKPFRDEKIRLYEVWARFDIDGDGIDEDIVAIFHLEGGIVLRAIHTPLLHGKRPFYKNVYLPFFGFYGRSLAEQDEWAQDMTTMLMNAQLHNVLLANSRMYAVPLGSGIQPGEPIYPGKIWFVGPDEQIGEIRMADIYASLPTTIGQIMQFSEMRTGVSEIRQGNLTGLPSRTPATSLLSILREGNKRFDLMLSSIRMTHSEMGLRMLQNVAQYVHDDPVTWNSFFTNALGVADARLIMEVLEGSIHDIEESFGVTVTATSAQVNKEVEKQAFIGLLQIVSQIYAQLTQTAMLMAQAPDPLTKETASSAYRAGVELLQRLLERFDIQNPSEYLPNLQALEGTLMAQQAGMNPALGFLGPAGQIPPQLLNQVQLGGLFGL